MLIAEYKIDIVAAMQENRAGRKTQNHNNKKDFPFHNDQEALHGAIPQMPVLLTVRR